VPEDIDEITRNLFAFFGQSENRVMLFRECLDGMDFGEYYKSIRPELGEDPQTSGNVEDAFHDQDLIYFENNKVNRMYFASQLVEPFKQIQDVARLYDEVAEILEHIPYWYTVFTERSELEALAEADYKTYDTSGRNTPYMGDYRERISDASQLREMLVWDPHQPYYPILKQWFDDGMSGQFVLKADDAGQQFDSEVGAYITDHGAQFLKYDGEYPFVFALCDQTVVIYSQGYPDEDIAMVLSSEDDRLYEWAKEEFSSLCDESDDWEP